MGVPNGTRARARCALRRSTSSAAPSEIVRAHLDRALDLADPASQRDLASAIFNHLVTPSGTKIAHAQPDLARYAGAVDGRARAGALPTLVRERILRPVAADGGAPRYEIYHDVLGEAVLAWRSGHEAERELDARAAGARRRHAGCSLSRRRRRAARRDGGRDDVFAFTQRSEARVQRSEARLQARQAQARLLTASAVSSLDQRSLAQPQPRRRGGAARPGRQT